MCGIVAQVGGGECRQRVVDGLRVLEYRGYDSAGVAFFQKGQLQRVRAVGHLKELEKALSSFLHDTEPVTAAIGHTRWATHGAATIRNAHPHFDCSQKISVVHNGIIEHCKEIRDQLVARGHNVSSQTDTELLAHLFAERYKEHGSLHGAACALLSELAGSFALVFLVADQPDKLVVIRKKSPLVVGKGAQSYMAASDQLALADDIKEMLFVPDDTAGVLWQDKHQFFSADGQPVRVALEARVVHEQHLSKGNFEHFMLKEMYEQRHVVALTVNRLNQEGAYLKLGACQLEPCHYTRICIIAAGTSWHAGRISQMYFERTAGIPTSVYLASEFRYMPFFPDKNALYIFISQSGETADTLEALRMVKAAGMHTLALTNVSSSTLVREAGGHMLMSAGPEISVASTKAFSCQVASLYWFSHYLAYKKGVIAQDVLHQSCHDVLSAGQALEHAMDMHRDMMRDQCAPDYASYSRMIFLGREISYPFALEAALKLKEISYIFAQCYPAGELKHGPIALVDDKTPIVIFSVLDELIYQKLLANVQEVKARGGYTIIFAFEGQDALIDLADKVFIIPRVKPLLAPLAMTGVMQSFAYEITRFLGHPIDKPRNLAKSVTVE